MSLRSDLWELSYSTFSKQDTASVSRYLSKLALDEQSFLHIVQGMTASVLIVDSSRHVHVQKMFRKFGRINSVGPLTAVTLHLSSESLAVPGVYYPLLRSLAREGISFVEILSGGTELSFLFDERNADRGFANLKNVIGVKK